MKKNQADYTNVCSKIDALGANLLKEDPESNDKVKLVAQSIKMPKLIMVKLPISNKESVKLAKSFGSNCSVNVSLLFNF